MARYKAGRAMNAPSSPKSKVSLKVIPTLSVGAVVTAPPVLIASNHSVD